MSVLFSVVAGLLASAAGVFLGAVMLDVFLLVLRTAIRPAESGVRSVDSPKGEPKRQPHTGAPSRTSHPGRFPVAHRGERGVPGFLRLN